MGTVYTFNVQFIMLFYYGQTDLQEQGFRLKINDKGLGVSPKNRNFQTRNDTFVLRYGGVRYPDHEAYFVLGTPPEGKRINATVSRIHTEANYDYVTLFWVDPSKQAAAFCPR